MNIKSTCPYCGNEHAVTIPDMIAESPAFNPDEFRARECSDCHQEWRSGLPTRIEFTRKMLPTFRYNEYEASFSFTDTTDYDRWLAASFEAERRGGNPSDVVVVDGFRFLRQPADTGVWPGDDGLAVMVVSKWKPLDERPESRSCVVDCTSRNWKQELQEALAFAQNLRMASDVDRYNAMENE